MNATPFIFWIFFKKIVKFDELLPKININLQCQWPAAFLTSAQISFPLRETGSRCYCSSILLSTNLIVFVQLRRGFARVLKLAELVPNLQDCIPCVPYVFPESGKEPHGCS